MCRAPKYPIPIPEPSAETQSVKRAAQEVAPYDYRRDACLPFYERHPEWKPRPISRREARRRQIREW